MIEVLPKVPTPERISHELAQAHEELESASDDVAKNRHNAAISSCYYACLHAARAVLYHHGLMPATHKGVMVQFHQHLVRTKVLSEEWGNLLDELRSERDLADYHSYSRSITSEETGHLLEQARRFVTKMEEVIQADRPAGERTGTTPT